MKNPGIMFINLLFLSFGCGGNMVEPVQKTPKIELVAASGNTVQQIVLDRLWTLKFLL